MPRLNLSVLVGAALISLICYRAQEHNSSLRMFQRAYSEIADHYVEPQDETELIEAAIRGMVGQLDENSHFDSPERSRELHSELHQQFYGIGIEVEFNSVTQKVLVVSPVVGSPAYEAGVIAGDCILEIDGKPTKGIPFDKIVNLIRGDKGVAVELQIERTGEDKPLKFSIVRAMIRENSVLGDIRDSSGKWNFTLEQHPEIAYARVTKFGERTVEELQTALHDLKKQSRIKALIIDLRGNGGGFLDTAVAMCNMFFKEGDIVSLRGRDKTKPRAYRADGSAEFTDFPMVVLVNRGSASASEIVAACLQDHKRAVICGERSYGKGTVQNVIPLEGDHSLKLTTSRYFRPSGKNIHRMKEAKETDEWGVLPEPDLEVKLKDQDIVKLMKARRNRDLHRDAATPDSDDEPETTPFSDEALQKAVDYLTTKMKSP